MNLAGEVHGGQVDGDDSASAVVTGDSRPVRAVRRKGNPGG